MKVAKAEPAEREERFIALPTAQQVEAALAEHQTISGPQSISLVRQYRRAQEMVYHAQRKAAVIAVRALKPHEYSISELNRAQQAREARREHEERMMAVFSEVCTRGF